MCFAKGSNCAATAWLDNPQDPAIGLYERTGLDVGACVLAGVVKPRLFVNDGDLVGI